MFCCGTCAGSRPARAPAEPLFSTPTLTSVSWCAVPTTPGPPLAGLKAKPKAARPTPRARSARCMKRSASTSRAVSGASGVPTPASLRLLSAIQSSGCKCFSVSALWFARAVLWVLFWMRKPSISVMTTEMFHLVAARGTAPRM